MSRLWSVVLVAALATSAQSEPVICPSGEITVEAPGPLATRICSHAEDAARQLLSCQLPPIPPVEIVVRPELPKGCFGQYHCGEGRIEILAPEATAALRGPESAFTMLSTDALYASVIRHELAHAALDDTPCPFESCITAQEYVAYNMQIMFLPDAERARFEAEIPYEAPISREALNPMILYMAPEIFVRKAWMHLEGRPDPCAFIGQVARGEVLLDNERP